MAHIPQSIALTERSGAHVPLTPLRSEDHRDTRPAPTTKVIADSILGSAQLPPTRRPLEAQPLRLRRVRRALVGHHSAGVSG